MDRTERDGRKNDTVLQTDLSLFLDTNGERAIKWLEQLHKHCLQMNIF